MDGLERDAERQTQLRGAEIDIQLLLASDRPGVALCGGLYVAKAIGKVGRNPRGHMIGESHCVLVLDTHRVRSLRPRP
jgi:hypothetical protein